MALREARGPALVTGASGGIGRALARLFARHGHDVVLVARSADRLDAVAREIEETFGVEAVAVPLDLGEADAPARLAEIVAARGKPVAHLVNNAGFGLAGGFAGHALEAELSLLDLNIRALTELTHRFLPTIREARGGILNVASSAAFLPGPYMASYYASKAYVLSFSEALAVEHEDEGVTVTALCPGPVETGFQARAGMGSSPLFRMLPTMSAEDVARKGFAAYRRGRRVCIPGAGPAIGVRLAGLAPRAATSRIAALLNRRRSSGNSN